MKLLILLLLPSAVCAFHFARRYSPDVAGWLLLSVSLIFYAVADIYGLPLLLCSIGFNYWISGRILRSAYHRRQWSTAGVIINLLPLVFYKYLRGPVPVSPTGLFMVAGIPLGLSFYTFQQITCLFDIQRPGAIRLPFMRHALFAGFFAQIPAGPVSKYRNLAPQMDQLGHHSVRPATIFAGGSLFLVGLAKKTFFADALGDLVNPFHAMVANGQHLSMAEAWFAAWAFVLQMYFDFSGYSDMAMGAALCFGITLPVNFNSPLKAISASDFVGRWHMSLVGWIREYLYQPTFDAVRKLPIQSKGAKRVAAWAVATIVSMTVIGAWHGRQFVLALEGFAAGTLLVLTQLPALLRTSISSPKLRRLHLGGRLRVLLGVSVLALALRVSSFNALVSFLRSMVDVRSVPLASALFAPSSTSAASRLSVGSLLPHSTLSPADYLTFTLATAIVLLLPNTMQMFDLLPRDEADGSVGRPAERAAWRPTLPWGFAIGSLALLELVFSASRAQGFIYAAF